MASAGVLASVGPDTDASFLLAMLDRSRGHDLVSTPRPVLTPTDARTLLLSARPLARPSPPQRPLPTLPLRATAAAPLPQACEDARARRADRTPRKDAEEGEEDDSDEEENEEENEEEKEEETPEQWEQRRLALLEHPVRLLNEDRQARERARDRHDHALLALADYVHTWVRDSTERVRRDRTRGSAGWKRPSEWASLRVMAAGAHVLLEQYTTERQRETLLLALSSRDFIASPWLRELERELQPPGLGPTTRRCVYVWRRTPVRRENETPHEAEERGRHGVTGYVGKTDQQRQTRDRQHRYGRTDFDLQLQADAAVPRARREFEWRTATVCEYSPARGHHWVVDALEQLFCVLLGTYYVGGRDPQRGLNTQIGGQAGADKRALELEQRWAQGERDDDDEV